MERDKKNYEKFDFCFCPPVHLIENHSMLDSGCLILEKSFTTESAEDADFPKNTGKQTSGNYTGAFAEKATKSTDFEGGAKTDKYMQNKIGGFCPPISEV